MNILFLDSIERDYSVDSAWTQPMGGTQSGVCYLAAQLASMGHTVFLLNHTAEERVEHGVRGLPIEHYFSQNEMSSLHLDAVVVVNSARNGLAVRRLVGKNVPVILWAHHLTDQPSMVDLKEPSYQQAFDGFAMVSQWQRDEYLGAFSLDPTRVEVMRNAISPHAEAFLDAPMDALLLEKTKPILTYTSTPFRGLDILVHLFPAIREQVPNCELHIYSSMKVYGEESKSDTQQFQSLYEQARATPGIEYKGSVSQVELAKAMSTMTALAYPNTYLETSCIAALEAMAVGLRVISTHAGALPETTAGFAHLVSSRLPSETYLAQFEKFTVQSLLERKGDGNRAHLEKQRDYIKNDYRWSQRARQWEAWLQSHAR